MEEVKKYRINFLVLIHIVAVVSFVYPYGFPLFTISVLSFFFYTITQKDISIKLTPFTIVIYLSIIGYMIGAFASKGIMYSIMLNDLNAIFMLLIIILCTGKLNFNEFKLTIRYFLIIYSCIAILIAVISLYKYYLLLNNVQIKSFEIPGRPYPWGTSLMPDYNMFALGMLIGLVSISYLIKTTKSFKVQLLGIMGSILVLISIILSGSRRGWLLVAFVAIYFLIQLFKKIRENNLRNNLSILIFLLAILVFLLSSFGQQIKYNFTNQDEIEKLQYRYSTLSDISNSYSGRTNRLNDAFNLAADFNILEVSFGSGFSYLSYFGNKYIGYGKEEYPHNPILSALLYSGVIGALIVLLTIMIPFIRILFERIQINNEYKIIYILVVIFLIQSSNSIFSNSLFWLIITIFALIPKINKREINNESNITSAE